MIYTSYNNYGFEKVLNLLKNHNAEYLSGQDLSDVLKISRVAVWKHMKKISSLGYTIESKHKLGYKLIARTKLPFPWEIHDGLKTKWLGKRICYFDSIDSTQTYASKIAENKKENGTIIIAQKQTRGKGRLDRKWISPDGGIWLSIIFQPKFDFLLSTLFPLAAAVALSDAIKKVLKISTDLKWPNDVLVNGKKVCGILTDVSSRSNQIDYIILGVGINFNIQASNIEKNIKNTGNYSGVSSLVQSSNDASAIMLVQSFLGELENVLDLLNMDKKTIIKKWTKRSSLMKKNITVKTTNGVQNGIALKIDLDGALVLKQNEKIHRVLAGDII